ncbi:23066_t:CDS:1, partial [Rhizophagus irregularis]
HGEGIIQIPRNDEITTKREPIIPASEVVNGNYSYGNYSYGNNKRF